MRFSSMYITKKQSTGFQKSMLSEGGQITKRIEIRTVTTEEEEVWEVKYWNYKKV